ncbi:MAG: glycerol-3-phosphate transporter permease [Pseudomonadota bacterium]|nr:sn-glycerol-3-phosphate ABC transporter permease UgpA [SAR324 cluster bacterium]GIR89875.1 MAG: glycerol-3-phosphate transporter permease [Pseudomonadota bacterium]|tara:strand:- start:9 stop:893 length:885 start_codon:yes stop_codon:yes gene_type:complete
MNQKIYYHNKLLAYLLIAPQILITLIFFIWPAAQALYQSFLVEDAFGLGSEFVWFENFIFLFEDEYYLDSFGRTALFSFLVAFVSMSFSLILAGFAERVIRGELIYKSLLIWPYAVAPVLAGALWIMLFDPSLGLITYYLKYFDVEWNYKLNGTQAMILVVLASAWKQVAYNFLFFLAGIHAIPKSMIEAAALDGSGPIKRFWTIIFPLISPVTFFLLVINTVYAFFDTFGIIHVMTQGGPANSTEILVYKVYNDGFIGLDLGGSAAQSVILMFIVISLTFFQFRFIEKKVEYK